ncbi:MAG: endonuclease/exonuclease/phosphatase family protein [Nocardioides sp.]
MKVATWNLENLFTPGDPDGPPDQETYAAKLAGLAGLIDELDPDVLAVQEVGSPEALADLVDRLDGSWQHALADPDGRGIRVGVITRRPVEEAEQVSDLPARIGPVRVDDSGTTLSTMGRPALRVRVLDDTGATLDVVSVHLKSKLLSFPGGRFSPRDEDERARYGVYALHRRAAEAAAVRTFVTDHLDDEGRDRALVVAGDLNDEPLAATTQILLGPPGSEIGTGGFDAPDQGDGARLWNLESLIPEPDRFSRVYRGRPELIDHLLVSRNLVTRVVEVSTGGPRPASITDDPRARLDEPASDHRPVLATFLPR